MFKQRYILLISLLFSILYTPPYFASSSIMHRTQQQDEGFKGNILDAKTNTPISFVKITVKELGIAQYTDLKGQFSLTHLPLKEFTLIIEHDAYITKEVSVRSSASVPLTLHLIPNVLDIKEVTILGKKTNKNGTSSTYINRKAIEHLQATSVQDILQLIPGQQVINPDFTNVTTASIRQYKTDNLGSLGTSITINGANISNNANLQAINTATAGAGASFSTSSGGGVDLRGINADNIESIEVVRGVPSVEYGDLNSGAIIINTKARKEPLQLKARYNPALTQYWAGKGFSLKKDHHNALFVDIDYTKSNDSETNKYRKYERITSSIQHTASIGKDKLWDINSTLAFGYSRDLYDMDPDFISDSLKNYAQDVHIRLSTNGNIRWDKVLSRNIKYSLSGNYTKQEGYQQRYYSADITAESYALENSTNAVPYLPSSYVSRMWVNGQPLTINAKISNQFYVLTQGFNHNVLMGAEWKMDANYGTGKTFTRPIRNTSGSAYRERAYNQIPALHQLSFYAQDHITKPFGNNKLNLIAGLRYDHIQPFDANYSLQALSPRVSLSFAFPSTTTLRMAYGVNVKSPTLLYLYPEKAYFDFYSLNYYATHPNERLALITTRVYDSQNLDLKLSKTEKTELGIDINLDKDKKKALYITGYYEKTKNGYSMSTTLESVKFAQYPIYTIESKPVGAPPILSPITSNKTQIVSYYTPSNNISRINKGVEFELNLGKIEPINTTINLSGAYTSTQSITNKEYIVEQTSGGTLPKRLGVFPKGRGSIEERCISTLRAIQHIPSLRFIITLSAQTIWSDTHQYVGYTSIPIGYIPVKENGNPDIIYFTEAERQAISPITDSDIYLNIRDEYHIKNKWKPLWLFNIRLTKEFNKGLNFSFFANNFINHRPLHAGTRYPNVYSKRNIEFFFGSEISIKL